MQPAALGCTDSWCGRRVCGSELKEEETEKSAASAAAMRQQMEALADAFAAADSQLYAEVAALTARQTELKSHHQQTVASLQRQLEAAQRDVVAAEAESCRLKAEKETEVRQARDALSRLEAELDAMTQQFADLLSVWGLEGLGHSREGGGEAHHLSRQLGRRAQEETLRASPAGGDPFS
ncbi:hypothetical protein Efla_002470 [Eimeria flavescens]